jgi:hypothetical protein
MNDFNFNTDFNFELNESKVDLHFKNRHESSEKIIDFTNISFCNEKMRYEIIRDLNFKIPILGENLFIITTKAISLLDIVNFIEKKIGQISDITIFFFTINDKAAKYTINLASRTKINILISDIMNSKRDKERMITRLFDESNVEIIFCHNHAKMVAFKIGENYFSLIGSMNAGTNAKIENLNIINSKEMYNFIIETFKAMKEKFSIKKKYEV